MIFNIIIFNKYKFFPKFLLNYPHLNRYNWTTNYSNFIKYINVNYIGIFFSENFFLKNLTIFDSLNDIIFFKKKSTMLKKNSDYEFNILNYSAKNKDSYYLNNDLHVLNKSTITTENSSGLYFDFLNLNNKFCDKKLKNNFNLKSLDLNKKINLIFKKNRVLLRKFLKVKFKRENTFNRYIKNFIKLKNLDFLFNFEYRLTNLLCRSLFFFNYSDCFWFLKNGYITVNGVVEYNKKKLIKPFQIVNVVYSDYYFFYYRFMLDNCLSNLYKFNSKIWKINNSRNLLNKNIKVNKKKNVEKYSNWIYKYVYYKNDIPKFIEVDYISMTMVLLNYSFNKNFIDYYNIKFLNTYLNRLYNWKTII